MGRPKKEDSKEKGLRIRMSEEDMDRLEVVSLYYPGKSKSEIIRKWIQNEYEKHVYLNSFL